MAIFKQYPYWGMVMHELSTTGEPWWLFDLFRSGLGGRSGMTLSRHDMDPETIPHVFFQEINEKKRGSTYETGIAGISKNWSDGFAVRHQARNGEALIL